MRALCALISINWNADDSATSFPCSAKQIGFAIMSATYRYNLQHTTRDINDSETVFRNIIRSQFARVMYLFVKLCVFSLLFYQLRP